LPDTSALDEIFGRKEADTATQLPQMGEAPQLQIIVTATDMETFRLISITKHNAMSILPLLVHQVIGAIREYTRG